MTKNAANTSDGDTQYATYWGIVWEQFRKNRVGYFAFYCVIALFAVAIYAPVFASKMPFFWSDDRGLSFPWFRSLLWNRNVYGSGIDIFFNLLLVLSPGVALSWLAVRRIGHGRDYLDRARLYRRWLWTCFGVMVFAFVALMMVDPKTAVLEYRSIAATGGAKGSLFPLLRIQYDDTLHGVTGEGIKHFLGKDSAGRDIFVRLLFGTRVSLSVGVIAVSIYITLGTALGALSGYFGGWIDIAIQRLLEIFLCFPSFFLILTFIGFLEQPSIVWVMVIIGVVGWTGPARLVRGEFLRLKSLDFVSAARAAGFGSNRIIFRHILPNALGPVLVNATFGVASSVLVESSLAFLGFGDPTLPSWGRILAFGRETANSTMMMIAGMAIFVTVSAFNLAGESFRDALDPKLRK